MGRVGTIPRVRLGAARTLRDQLRHEVGYEIPAGSLVVASIHRGSFAVKVLLPPRTTAPSLPREIDGVPILVEERTAR